MGMLASRWDSGACPFLSMLSAQPSVLITARLRSVNAGWVMRLAKLCRVVVQTGASQSERRTQLFDMDRRWLGMLDVRMQGACIHRKQGKLRVGR